MSEMPSLGLHDTIRCGEGAANQQIEKVLCHRSCNSPMSCRWGETTVKTHVSEISRKLNVYSRTQAVIEVSKLDSAELFRDQAGF